MSTRPRIARNRPLFLIVIALATAPCVSQSAGGDGNAFGIGLEFGPV